MLIISAWLNISMDPVQGNNQTHTSYLNQLWNYYEGNKEGGKVIEVVIRCVIGGAKLMKMSQNLLDSTIRYVEGNKVD